jgi:hypothetical protein
MKPPFSRSLVPPRLLTCISSKLLEIQRKKKEEGPWTTNISKTLFCCSPSLHETVSLGQAIFGVCPFFLPDLLVDMASYWYDRRRLYRNELFPALHFLRDVIKGELVRTNCSPGFLYANDLWFQTTIESLNATKHCGPCRGRTVV